VERDAALFRRERERARVEFARERLADERARGGLAELPPFVERRREARVALGTLHVERDVRHDRRGPRRSLITASGAQREESEQEEREESPLIRGCHCAVVRERDVRI